METGATWFMSLTNFALVAALVLVRGRKMADLVDRHELRLALEAEERNTKRVLGTAREPLVTMFFEIVYRTLNKQPFPVAPTHEGESHD
jgi:hypothetical protein